MLNDEQNQGFGFFYEVGNTFFSLLIKGDFEAFRLLTSKIVLDIVVVGCDFSHVKKVLTTFVSRNPNQFHTKKR